MTVKEDGLRTTLILMNDKGRKNVDIVSSPRDSWNDLVTYVKNNFPDWELIGIITFVVRKELV